MTSDSGLDTIIEIGQQPALYDPMGWPCADSGQPWDSGAGLSTAAVQPIDKSWSAAAKPLLDKLQQPIVCPRCGRTDAAITRCRACGSQVQPLPEATRGESGITQP